MELQNIFKFYGLDVDGFEELPQSFTLQKYSPNEVVVREGEAPNRFYFIRSGKALVSRRSPSGDDEPLGVLKEGDFFGEIGLMEGMGRTATVKALVDLEVFQMEKERFSHLMATHAAFSSLITRIGNNRLLGQASLFRDLDELSLMRVEELLIEKIYPEKTVIFNENDPADAFYIIVKGAVRVSKKTSSGRDMTLSCLGQGDFFGEMGLLEEERRSATVVTTEPSKLLMLPKYRFQSLLKENPLIAFNMLKVLSQRMRRNDREMALARGSTVFKGMTIISRPERCLSCKACEIACAVSKSTSHRLYDAIFEEPLPVKRIHVRKTGAGSGPAIRPEHCHHCQNAPCLAQCKFNAIKRDTGSGTIVLSEENCKGCGLCAKACPFNVITLIRSDGKKRIALKCTYCAEHQAGPACVRSCPTHALVISLAPLSGGSGRRF